MATEDRLNQREIFGKLLREAREKEGLSQRQLAALCGVDSADIGRIERAEIDPRLSTILELAEALGLNLSDLCNGV